MRRPDRRDLLVAAPFVAWALGEIVSGVNPGPVAVAVPATLLGTAPLAWRRISPIAAGLCCAGGLALQTALGVPLNGMALAVAALVAAYSAARHRPLLPAALTVTAMLVLVWLALFGLPQRSAGDYLFAALFLAAPGVAGAALRIRIAQAERLAERVALAEAGREAAARAAVQAERMRIARELHDIVAHTISVMILQAGAVRSRLPDGLATERGALDRSEQAGRQALVELGRLLGVLRSESEAAATAPQPTLADVAALLDSARDSGLAVELTVDGARRPLDPAVEVSAYRIVQEALTNVRKHARATAVSVRLAYEKEWLRVSVTDDGVGPAAAAVGRSAGFGLLGMRERVELFGGRLWVGSPESAGFAVEVALPVGP